VTGRLIVCSYCVYALKDPVLPYHMLLHLLGGKLCIAVELLYRPFIVSTPISEFIIAKRVYLGCTKEIINRQTSLDHRHGRVRDGLCRRHYGYGLASILLC